MFSADGGKLQVEKEHLKPEVIETSRLNLSQSAQSRKSVENGNFDGAGELTKRKIKKH